MRLTRIVQKLLIIITPVAIAVDMSVYDAAVLLESHTPANSTVVLKQGMLQVLVKVSGRDDIGEIAIIKKALAKPENYLSKYSAKLTDTMPGSVSEQVFPAKRRVSIQSYLANRIDDLLKNANIANISQPVIPVIDQKNQANIDDKITQDNKNQEAEAVSIRINGINSLDAYAKVNAYLSSLPGVDSINLNKLDADSLDLVINTKNGRKSLLDILNQDSQFNQSNKYISQSTNDNLLQFRWRS